MKEIIVIAHDIRSTHNIGSLFRTAEIFGVTHVYCSGYTPYPELVTGDERLPHIRRKLSQQIEKTALGTTEILSLSHEEDILSLVSRLRAEGYTIVALEQTNTSVSLPLWRPDGKIALLIGREVEGVDENLLRLCNIAVEIPQFGHKESLNVIQATAIALYYIQTVV